MLSRICLGVALSIASVPMLSLTGCATSTYGTKIDETKVPMIQKGVTTRSDLEQMFGAPMQASLYGAAGDGKKMLIWTYAESKAQVIPFGHSSSETKQQILQVLINKDQIVEDYEFTGNGATPQRQLNPVATQPS